MRFILTTISGVKYDGEVAEVGLPTLDGRIGVMDNHMPLFSVVAQGAIAIRKLPHDPDSAMEYFATYGGVIEVSQNTLRVLVDEAHQPDEINEQEAQIAMERAKQMKISAKDQASLDHAQTIIDRQAVRLQVASLRHRRRQ